MPRSPPRRRPAHRRPQHVLGELVELTAANPLRENLWALYLTALYRNGQQAHALAAYQSLRRTLADELGLEPAPPLRALHDAILRQDPALLDGTPPPAGTETVAETRQCTPGSTSTTDAA